MTGFWSFNVVLLSKMPCYNFRAKNDFANIYTTSLLMRIKWQYFNVSIVSQTNKLKQTGIKRGNCWFLRRRWLSAVEQTCSQLSSKLSISAASHLVGVVMSSAPVKPRLLPRPLLVESSRKCSRWRIWISYAINRALNSLIDVQIRQSRSEEKVIDYFVTKQ